MSVKEFIKKVQSGEIDVVEHTHKALNEINKINKEYHYLNVIAEKEAILAAESLKKNPKGKLAGLLVSVKDCICVKGIESRAGSKILSGYKPTFDATIISRLKKEGAIIIGKTSQDEFGFGVFNVNVGIDFKIPLNPFDKERSCGGSSGGSGGITKKLTFPHISIGESTGGSITCPASFNGISGLCPTYGRVSRYGLLDYANSLDKIGPMAKSVSDCAIMLNIISGHDSKDSTSLNESVPDYQKSVGKDISGLKIGIIKEGFGEGIDENISKAVWNSIKKLESDGAKIEEISLPINHKYSLASYYLIATSEASTNLAKFCGIRYGKTEKLEGNFNEYFKKVRSENFGLEAKRRIMLGTFARMAGYRDAYYIKAAQIRTKIIEEYKKHFKNFDVLISPSMPILPPKFSEIEKLSPIQHYMMDVLTVGSNLAGMPSLSVPIGHSKNLPVGMMLIADHLNEEKLIQLGSSAEVVQ